MLFRSALTQLKKWLRSHTSAKDLGDGAKEDITEAITGILGKVTTSGSHPPPSDDPPPASGTKGLPAHISHGITGILSKKLGRGLGHVRASTRDDFRSMLSAIESTLFNELPDSIRGPLAKIFGGDPFDPNVPSTARGGGGGGDIFQELGDKFKAIVERVQKGLRDRVLEVVSGGHRRLESIAWVQVQETVVLKVTKYVPDKKTVLMWDDDRFAY